MARTSRNSVSNTDDAALAAAASLDADALDDLNLDDMMFGEGGDDLFGGLDIDLDGMGDIPKSQGDSQAQLQTQPQAALVMEPLLEPEIAPTLVSKRRGAHTQRPSLPADTGDDTPSSRGPRRKAKRKSKAPPSWNDDTSVNTNSNADSHSNTNININMNSHDNQSQHSQDVQPKTKKKRTSASSLPTTKRGSKKKGASKFEKAIPPPSAISNVLPMASTKKSKKESAAADRGGMTKMTMPLVAAAGQFGGRAASGNSKKGATSKGTKKRKSGASGPTSSLLSTSSHGEPKQQQSLLATANYTASAAYTSTSSTLTADAALAGSPRRASFLPQSERAYCGLDNSATLFYPFLPGLPTQSGMKTRKAYPTLDKISSNFSSAMNGLPATGTNDALTSQRPPTLDAAMVESSIYKLLLETYEVNEKDKAAFGLPKRIKLQQSILGLRSTIGGLEKDKLVADLFSLCQLLQRQHDFLQQNLDNMQNWCKGNFTELDYQLTYHSEQFGNTANNSVTTNSSTTTGNSKNHNNNITNSKLRKSATGKIVSPNFLSMRTPFVGIRVKCSALSELQLQTASGAPSNILVAELPTGILDLLGPEADANASSEANAANTPALDSKAGGSKTNVASTSISTSIIAKSSTSKKAAPKTSKSKGSSSSKSKAGTSEKPKGLPSTSAAVVAAEIHVQQKNKSVGTCFARERRQKIWDHIQTRAAQFEAQHTIVYDAKQRILQRKAEAAANVVEQNDSIVSLHTQAMWTFLEAGGYLESEFGFGDINQQLQPFWSAYVNQRFPLSAHHAPRIIGRQPSEPELKEVHVTQNEDDPFVPAKTDTETDLEPLLPSCSISLVDRLQSLLVEEGGSDLELGDGDPDDSDSESDSQFDDDGSVHHRFGEYAEHERQFVDLSQFSIEERLFLHLKSVGLVKANICSETKLNLQEINADKDKTLQVKSNSTPITMSNSKPGEGNDGVSMEQEKASPDNAHEPSSTEKNLVSRGPENLSAHKIPDKTKKTSNDNNTSSSQKSPNENASDERTNAPSDMHGSISDLLALMGEDLEETTQLNNARLLYLQSSAQTHCQQFQNTKKQNEQENTLIDKCKALIAKRSKARQVAEVVTATPSASIPGAGRVGGTGGESGKGGAKDEYKLPW